MGNLEEKRRFLNAGQEPSLPFVVEFFDGRIGEAIDPLYLMDLIIHPDFSDIDEVETMYLLGVKTLRDVAATTLAMQGIRAVVYDGLGPIYDNGVPRYEDEELESSELEFKNPDNPVILDGWDPWTVVASLIKVRYIKIIEKQPVWSDKEKIQGCSGCSYNSPGKCLIWGSEEAKKAWDATCFFVSNGPWYQDYHEVKPDEIAPGIYKKNWVPIEQRNKKHMAN